MHPIIRKRLERAASHATTAPAPRVWSVSEGLHYCAALPVRYLEPICERVSRVQGEKFAALVASIGAHGLANPLITVSDLPAPNFDDWKQYRFRFLWTIGAPIKIVVGHNRYAAILALGWTHVPILHCGPIPPEARRACRWRKLKGISAAQKLCRDGTLGLGPFSLVMDQFTPPLKSMPAGFEVAL